MQSFQSGIKAIGKGGVNDPFPFLSELHSLETMFVDVNSTAAAAVSDACTVFVGVGFKAECSILSGTDTPLDARRNIVLALT